MKNIDKIEDSLGVAGVSKKIIVSSKKRPDTINNKISSLQKENSSTKLKVTNKKPINGKCNNKKKMKL